MAPYSLTALNFKRSPGGTTLHFLGRTLWQARLAGTLALPFVQTLWRSVTSLCSSLAVTERRPPPDACHGLTRRAGRVRVAWWQARLAGTLALPWCPVPTNDIPARHGLRSPGGTTLHCSGRTWRQARLAGTLALPLVVILPPEHEQCDERAALRENPVADLDEPHERRI